MRMMGLSWVNLKNHLVGDSGNHLNVAKKYSSLAMVFLHMEDGKNIILTTKNMPLNHQSGNLT